MKRFFSFLCSALLAASLTGCGGGGTNSFTWYVDAIPVNGIVVTIIAAREFLVSGLRLVTAEKGVVVAAGIWGKLKTVSQLFCIIYLLSGLPEIMIAGIGTRMLSIWIVVFFTIFSGTDYLAKNFDLIKDGLVKKG